MFTCLPLCHVIRMSGKYTSRKSIFKIADQAESVCQVFPSATYVLGEDQAAVIRVRYLLCLNSFIDPYTRPTQLCHCYRITEEFVFQW